MEIEILDSSGTVINTIIADADFADAFYPNSWREKAKPEPEPEPIPQPITLDEAKAAKVVEIKAEAERRITALDWRLQRAQERERLAGATDLESRVSLAMVNTHPSESVASRRAGLDKLKALLPELGLDAQAFLRSWIALGEELLVRDSRRDDQSQEVKRLRQQIEQLSAIDEQLNQRKLNGGGQP